MTHDFSVSLQSSADKTQKAEANGSKLRTLKDPEIYDSDVNSSNNEMENIKRRGD